MSFAALSLSKAAKSKIQTSAAFSFLRSSVEVIWCSLKGRLADVCYSHFRRAAQKHRNPIFHQHEGFKRAVSSRDSEGSSSFCLRSKQAALLEGPQGWPASQAAAILLCELSNMHHTQSQEIDTQLLQLARWDVSPLRQRLQANDTGGVTCRPSGILKQRSCQSTICIMLLGRFTDPVTQTPSARKCVPESRDGARGRDGPGRCSQAVCLRRHDAASVPLEVRITIVKGLGHLDFQRLSLKHTKKC